MATSVQQQTPVHPPETSSRPAASNQPSQERVPEQGTPSTTNTEQWSPAQLYLLIQRAALKVEKIHIELQRRCTKQRNHITVLTEQRNQLLREKTSL